ncbi:MAG: alpha/beta hydrolase domain-containing protein [Gemmatimonadota bacterium]
MPRRALAFALLFAAALHASAAAQVTRIEIDRREPFAAGQSFGDVGAYEKLVGSMYVDVDPGHAANQRIADLQLAPRNGRGMVEYRTDFYLLKPVDPSRGNGVLLYDVHNRGSKVALGSFNGAGGNDPDNAGSGFLMERGYSVLWTGWSGDVIADDNRLVADFPVATQNGEPITGRIYTEWESGGYQLYRNNFVTRTRESADQPLFSIPFDWGGSKPYAAVSLDNSDATLTMRPRRDAPAVEVPRDRWQFARVEDGRIISDPTQVYLVDGFRLGWLYDLVYTGVNPRVTGLGFTAVRDPVAFFRYERAADGTPNPLTGAIRHAYAFGVSQSGRYLNHFLYEGFNTDTDGRIVFDGVLAEVAGGGKGLFNYRFAQATRHGSQHEDNLYPSDFFPFTTVPQTDPVTGASGDLLERVRRAGHVPKLFYLQTSTEYWSRAASLLHTDVEGTRDVALDPNVRVYFVAGTPHNAMSGGHYEHPVNRSGRGTLTRALLVALDEWVRDDREPPPSRYPRIADGTLVPLETFRAQFPAIRGVHAPTVVFAPLRIDPGPRWYTDGIADHAPPRTGPAFRTLVPAVDADGNERAGIHPPDVAVPLATLTGWNLRAREWGADGMLTRWMGSSLEFAATREERDARGDPRPSVRERYPTRDAYLERYDAAIRALIEQRLLLPDDAEALRGAAARRDVW